MICVLVLRPLRFAFVFDFGLGFRLGNPNVLLLNKYSSLSLLFNEDKLFLTLDLEMGPDLVKKCPNLLSCLLFGGSVNEMIPNYVKTELVKVCMT